MSLLHIDPEVSHERHLLDTALPEVSEASAEQYELEAARVRFERGITALDLSDVLCDGDVAERLIAMFRAQDANGIGRLVCAELNAWLDRLAEREVYGEPLSRLPAMDAPWRLPAVEKAKAGECI